MRKLHFGLSVHRVELFFVNLTELSTTHCSTDAQLWRRFRRSEFVLGCPFIHNSYFKQSRPLLPCRLLIWTFQPTALFKLHLLSQYNTNTTTATTTNNNNNKDNNEESFFAIS